MREQYSCFSTNETAWPRVDACNTSNRKQTWGGSRSQPDPQQTPTTGNAQDSPRTFADCVEQRAPNAAWGVGSFVWLALTRVAWLIAGIVVFRLAEHADKHPGTPNAEDAYSPIAGFSLSPSPSRVVSVPTAASLSPLLPMKVAVLLLSWRGLRAADR
jgi:hypothetical protein